LSRSPPLALFAVVFATACSHCRYARHRSVLPLLAFAVANRRACSFSPPLSLSVYFLRSVMLLAALLIFSCSAHGCLVYFL